MPMADSHSVRSIPSRMVSKLAKTGPKSKVNGTRARQNVGSSGRGEPVHFLQMSLSSPLTFMK